MSTGTARSPRVIDLDGDIELHDPALVAGGGGQDWFVYGSGTPERGGGSIQIRRSVDGVHWRDAGTGWPEVTWRDAR